MKKIIGLFLILFTFNIMHADVESTKVVSGSASTLKDGGNIVIEFDFEGAMWDKKQPLSNHYPNLEQLIPVASTRFTGGFEDKAKKSHIVDDKEDAKFVVTIKVKNMDSYYSVMGFVPGHVTKCWCNITVMDINSGEKVCVIAIEECEGDRDFSVDDSFGDCFEELGEIFAKIMKKGKA